MCANFVCVDRVWIMKKNIKISGLQKDYIFMSEKIYYDFQTWINSIEEDDPLPFEVNYIVLNVSFQPNFVNIALSGHELKPKQITNGLFCPLEAQSFYSVSLQKAYQSSCAFFYKVNKGNKLNLKVFFIYKLLLSMIKRMKQSFSNPILHKTIIIGKSYSKLFTIYMNE